MRTALDLVLLGIARLAGIRHPLERRVLHLHFVLIAWSARNISRQYDAIYSGTLLILEGLAADRRQEVKHLAFLFEVHVSDGRARSLLQWPVPHSEQAMRRIATART